VISDRLISELSCAACTDIHPGHAAWALAIYLELCNYEGRIPSSPLILLVLVPWLATDPNIPLSSVELKTQATMRSSTFESPQQISFQPYLMTLERNSTQLHGTFSDVHVHVQALQAQNLMWAPAAVTVSMFFVNIAFNALLVSLYGFTGAAYAQSASRIAQFLLLTGKASFH